MFAGISRRLCWWIGTGNRKDVGINVYRWCVATQDNNCRKRPRPGWHQWATPLRNDCLSPNDHQLGMIQNKISAWSAQGSGIDAILTTGGTGFGPRDLTPEAIKPLLHRDAPGVAQALINEGLKHTPLAVMSRPVVGTINQTLVCTLPGRYRLPSVICELSWWW